jgi:M3 family oligoendopeptidase
MIEKFKNAGSADEQLGIINEINAIRRDVETMATIASIRYTINTADAAAEAEQNFFNDYEPVYGEVISCYYKALIDSKFRSELESKVGKQLFNIAELTVKTISPEVLDDMKLENQLKTDYRKLKASAKIQFDGKECNLTDIKAYMEEKDRSKRKAAHEAYWEFFSRNQKEFDEIFDKLVKLRDKIAKKLGYKNFVELGYARMKRSDYTAENVANFRKQVLENIVPVAVKLKERQAKRLGLDKMAYYDDSLDFANGNPNPKGSHDWIVDNARKMYDELSPETGEFMNFMINTDLMDLLNRKNKAVMGYCDFMPSYKSPFIYAMFNGTADDIRVLTHEAGHAFQAYCSRDFEIPEYYHPTYEACEIHSMSMEFITWPWMKMFFNGETDKFKFSHLGGALEFLPYGVSVDEFQHYVYENVNDTPEMRRAKWREIEKKYMPYKDYTGNDFLDKGGYWFQQGHIFESPFYYIDYCLAQICAFQFWKKANEDSKLALSEYIELCKAGGSKPFLELVKLANLKSPFDDGTVSYVTKDIAGWLNGVNDSSF